MTLRVINKLKLFLQKRSSKSSSVTQSEELDEREYAFLGLLADGRLWEYDELVEKMPSINCPAFIIPHMLNSRGLAKSYIVVGRYDYPELIGISEAGDFLYTKKHLNLAGVKIT